MGITTKPSAKLTTLLYLAILLFSSFLIPLKTGAQNDTTWGVNIVLPPRLVAGERATLATFGVDGKLAPHISVDLSTGDKVETDTTGRAVFVVPKTGPILIARAAGASV